MITHSRRRILSLRPIRLAAFAAVLGVIALVGAPLSSAGVPVVQYASGTATDGGSVHIDQTVILLSIVTEDGAGGTADQSSHTIWQAARAVATNGASVNVRQDVIDTTIAEAFAAGTGTAVGAGDSDHVNQEVSVAADGPITVDVQQVAGLFDVAAASADTGGAAVGTDGEQHITQVVVWRARTTPSSGSERLHPIRATRRAAATPGTRPRTLSTDEIDALLEQARSATAAVLDANGVPADVQADWVSSVEIDRKDVYEHPSEGVTVHQSVAVIVVHISPSAIEGLHEPPQTATAALVATLPTPSGVAEAPAPTSSAAVVGSHTDSVECQEIGAPQRCLPPPPPPPPSPDPTPQPDPTPAPTVTPDPVTPAPETVTPPEVQPVVAAAELTCPAAVLPAAPSEQAAPARTGVQAGDEVLGGVALIILGLALSLLARDQRQRPRVRSVVARKVSSNELTITGSRPFATTAPPVGAQAGRARRSSTPTARPLTKPSGTSATPNPAATKGTSISRSDVSIAMSGSDRARRTRRRAADEDRRTPLVSATTGCSANAARHLAAAAESVAALVPGAIRTKCCWPARATRVPGSGGRTTTETATSRPPSRTRLRNAAESPLACSSMRTSGWSWRNAAKALGNSTAPSVGVTPMRRRPARPLATSLVSCSARRMASSASSARSIKVLADDGRNRRDDPE